MSLCQLPSLSMPVVPSLEAIISAIEGLLGIRIPSLPGIPLPGGGAFCPLD